MRISLRTWAVSRDIPVKLSGKHHWSSGVATRECAWMDGLWEDRPRAQCEITQPGDE